MRPLERYLTKQGYKVVNVNYPSRKHQIATLADRFVAPAVKRARQDGAKRIHFVTHSLGGILVREYLSRNEMPDLKRVVMLGPPNQGSEVTDRLSHWKLYQWINGPAGQQLGTAPDSVPNQLGPATFELGIIAGNRSINWIHSVLMIPGRDDGKVSVARTRLRGMTDHLTVPYSHPMLIRRDRVWRQISHFLGKGRFEPVSSGKNS